MFKSASAVKPMNDVFPDDKSIAACPSPIKNGFDTAPTSLT